MPAYVALLRAVNVKPRWVKMERLRTVLSANGFSDVATHIQSGNVYLRTPVRAATKVRSELQSLLSAEFGFDIPVVVRTPAQLAALAELVDTLRSPLSADARVYVALADQRLQRAATDRIEAWDEPGERAEVHGSDVVLWLDVPAHAAKLTNARLEKLTGTTMTTRDLKVVRALAAKWAA